MHYHIIELSHYHTSVMKLHLKFSASIGELQKQFAAGYPYLKLNFYSSNKPLTRYRGHLWPGLSLLQAGLKKETSIVVDVNMTVQQLESLFRKELGLNMQLSRKSGILWLETTMSDSWTLTQQNEHGKELSQPLDVGYVSEIDYE